MSKEKLIDLDQEQLDLLHPILKRHIPNKTVWAYGSRVNWKAGETSDLDLAVFGCDPMEIYELKEALEESDLLISVDVMDWESIPESFRENIREKYVVVQGEEARRPEGWKEVRLGDVITIIGGGTPKTSVPEYWDGDIPWLAPPDFTNCNRWAKHTQKTITEAGLKNSSTKMLETSDLIISARGTVGALAQLKKPMAFSQTNYGLKANNQYTNNDFLFYVLKYNLKKFKRLSYGAVFDTITTATFNEITIDLPTFPEQKAIAEVLSSLDDKIDLLHRQNKTLEAMAQALFRKWFVQGKDGTWEQGKLGEVFTVKGGTTPSTKEKNYWNGDINWTTPRDLSGHKAIFLLNTEKRITEQGLAKISSGLLPTGTVLLSSRAPVGYLAITEINLAINQGYIAIVCDKILSNYFVYLWCKHNIKTIKNSSGGTVFQELPKSVFREIDIAIPPKKLLLFFDRLVEPIFQKTKRNQYQIQNLENMRETLLPKLMNGEVKLIPTEKRDHEII